MAEGLKFVNGDWSIGHNGAVEVVTGREKLSRDFNKMMTTDAETPQNQTDYYRYNPAYGNYVNNPSLFSNMPQTDKLNAISELMYNTIQNYLTLQEERTNLSLAEVIANIDFDTYFDVYDPTKVIIPIRITNGEGLELSQVEFEQRVS
jgi:hypothetical protein